MRNKPISPELLDQADRSLINRLQEGFPLTSHPFAEIGTELGLEESNILERLTRLREIGAITRFGPFMNAETMGGAFCLCAMAVPAENFDDVAAMVNSRHEVAHNYERDHKLNMWFVLACDDPDNINRTAKKIEKDTGLEVLLFPKLREFFIGFRVAA